MPSTAINLKSQNHRGKAASDPYGVVGDSVNIAVPQMNVFEEGTFCRRSRDRRQSLNKVPSRL